MNYMKLVIAGAIFHEVKRDIMVVPLRTGEFNASECRTYYKKSDYLKRYGRKQFLQNINDYIIDDIDGQKYYFADDREIVSHIHLDLVSDLSNLIFTE